MRAVGFCQRLGIGLTALALLGAPDCKGKCSKLRNAYEVFTQAQGERDTITARCLLMQQWLAAPDLCRESDDAQEIKASMNLEPNWSHNLPENEYGCEMLACQQVRKEHGYQAYCSCMQSLSPPYIVELCR